jgi:hypothetical protein
MTTESALRTTRRQNVSLSWIRSVHQLCGRAAASRALGAAISIGGFFFLGISAALAGERVVRSEGDLVDA